MLVLGQLPQRKITPNPKTNLTFTQTPTVIGGQISSGAIVRIPFIFCIRLLIVAILAFI